MQSANQTIKPGVWNRKHKKPDEPEVIGIWLQNESPESKSFHIHSSNTYQLLRKEKENHLAFRHPHTFYLYLYTNTVNARETQCALYFLDFDDTLDVKDPLYLPDLPTTYRT